jgi:hypothetical protein
MKNKTQNTGSSFARFVMVAIIGFTLPIACQKDEVVPKKPVEINVPGTEITESDFTIKSTKIKETSAGYDFKGQLGVKADDGQEFEIGKGDFQVVLKPEGGVSAITGTGIPAFPKIGVFAELLKEFTFNEIQSRIEYNTGKYYKDTYNTDIPLDDATLYVHFKVLNESRDGAYELRHKVNTAIYKFYDLYIDPHDPALFFKVQLWKPGSSGNPEAVISQFWKRTFENLKALGKAAKDFKGSPNLIFGISNHARFRSTEYEFTITNKEAFKELHGFDRFESLNSHLYLKLDGIPIPETVVLQLSGEMYIHEPVETLTPSPEEIKEKKLNAFLDWFREGEDESKMATFAGKMDPGDKGIETLLTGVLPKVNEILGRDIFNDDLNIDLVGATLQYAEPSRNGQPGSSFLRFGGQINKPIILDILGDDIKPYLVSTPGFSSYLYFSVGPTLEDCSIFTETSLKLIIPTYGETEFNKSYFLINKDGLNFSGTMDLPLGPIHLSKSLEGNFTGNNFRLESHSDNDITLPNGVVLTGKELHVVVSKEQGVEVDGSILLPFGLGEGEITGKVSDAGMSFSGSLKAGTTINLGNGLQLPTADLTFSSSTDPNEGIHFQGKVQIPHQIGYVEVEGHLTKDGFSFTGIVDRQILIGGVSLLSKSGKLTISNTGGLYFETSLALGAVFGDQKLKGHITANEIDLVGSFNRAIPIGGHSFTFASGKITANSSTGVNLSGNIDLYVFKVNVNGKMSATNDFLLTGKYTYNGTFLKSTINTEVKPTSVNLKGTGSVYGVLGNELYTGTITFKPNWGAQTISGCYNDICLSL